MAAGRAAARASALGIGALLDTLHPGVRWNGAVLSIDTVTDADVELCDRALVLRPSAADAESVVLGFPATRSILSRDSRTRTASPALSALLGATRAAVCSPSRTPRP